MKKPPCQHLTDGGECRVNRWPRPAPGVCMDQRLCKKYSGPERTPELIAEVLGDKAKAKPVQCGCSVVKIHRSLGIDYYGVPIHRRVRFRSPIYVKRMPGCGCIVRLRDWWIEVYHGPRCGI